MTLIVDRPIDSPAIERGIPNSLRDNDPMTSDYATILQESPREYRLATIVNVMRTRFEFNRFLGRIEKTHYWTAIDSLTMGRNVMGNYTPTVWLDPSDPFRI